MSHILHDNNRIKTTHKHDGQNPHRREYIQIASFREIQHVPFRFIIHHPVEACLSQRGTQIGVTLREVEVEMRRREGH